MGPAADAAAQLMKLRQPEPLGMLDDHDGGVRHVDAHLDHRRRHQHLHVTRANARIEAPLVGLQPSVHDRRGDLREHVHGQMVSAIPVAARTSTSTDSSTSGYMTYACRPASSSPRTKS